MGLCFPRSVACVTLLILVLVPPAQAFTGLGFGVKAGVVTNYENPNLKVSDFEFDNLKFFGAFMKWGSSSFDLEIGAEYYWDSQQLRLLGEELKVDAKDFYIGATGKYYFSFPLLQPFLGAGLAAHRFTFQYNGPLGELEEVTIIIPADETRLGFHLVAGARLSTPALPFDLFVEGKIGRVNTEPADTEFTILSGGITLSLP